MTHNQEAYVPPGDLTAEQKMRDSGIKAAAALCGLGTPMEDVLFIADVFAGYIEGGWESALRIKATSAKPGGLSPVQTVELREPETPAVHEKAPDPAPSTPSRTPSPEPEPTADVIPMTGRNAPAQESTGARKVIEKTRRQRAEQILKESKVAKAPDHKRRLIDDATRAGLTDFVLDVGGGEMQKLGSYLDSL